MAGDVASAGQAKMSKRKAEQEGWDFKEKDIRDLYITRNLTLNKVMDAMRQQGFDKRHRPILLPIGPLTNIRTVNHSTKTSSEHEISSRTRRLMTGNTSIEK
jgi:hypothetical protein